MRSNEAKKGGVKSRQGLYAYANKYSKEAIDVLVGFMRNSRNEGIRFGAARAILDKCLPDLKATDASLEEEREPLEIVIVEEKPIPPDGKA